MGASEAGIAAGSWSVRKWVRKEGMRVVRTVNQWADRRVKSMPLDGIPCVRI